MTLYDPKKLQVRVEVPVAKFALVRSGQPAEVEVEDVLPGVKIAGTVLYDTHQANVSRNSVPVKVALPDDPPAASVAKRLVRLEKGALVDDAIPTRLQVRA